MKVFVVLHQESKCGTVRVLDVYTDEDKANRRVVYERGLTDEIIWYQESDLLSRY